jgi:protoporphyrinogen oxidase
VDPLPVVVIGAGPAGLTAAYELVRRNIQPVVLEQADKVGGLARTESYKGYGFDIGGHRFYTKVKDVEQLWHATLGKDFIEVPRLSRIYYQGKFFNYPIDLFNTLLNLGPVESLRILVSYLKAQLWPYPEEENFEEWVSNRFGRRLYETFFKTYTEKVWGIPCNEIRADWAAQRIMDLSLTSAVTNALFGTNGAKTLIDEFHYPVRGPGMMWERFKEVVEDQGGRVYLNSEVVRLNCSQDVVESVTVQRGNDTVEITGEHFISSMPLTELMARLSPPPLVEVCQATRELSYRAFIIVGLIIDRADVFPDNWIYVHSPAVNVGRIQNFKNWSASMVPDPEKTSLGMEFFCDVGDEIWAKSDIELIALATHELAQLGLADAGDVEDGVVIRQPHAYPVYDADYRQHLEVIRQYLTTIRNLQTIGRNGMHRYNNQDHSMLTGILAARNLLGEDHDLWQVNTERSYYEDFATES